MSRFTAFACLCLSLPVAVADDPILADLDRAKAAHAKELARLREQLLADIDAVIRAEQDRGAGVNYLLKERKGFAENGVLPILPKLLPASRRFADGQRAADAELEAAYRTAIDRSLRARNFDQAAALRGELKRLRGTTAARPGGPAEEDAPPPREDLAAAKDLLAAALKAAAADLLDAFDEARRKVAAAMIGDTDKLRQLDRLARERDAFVAEGILPTFRSLAAAVRKYREAVAKARQDFGRAADAVAKGYLDRKDTVGYERVLREKQRTIDRPAAIDLLALIDLTRDALRGPSELTGGVLTVPGSGNALVQIPYEPGPEYDVHLTVERLDGDDLVAVGLIARGNQFYALFDGWPAAGCRSGIQYIDGKLLLHNGTEKAGRVLPVKTRVDLDIAVRKDAIRVWAQGPGDRERRPVVNYTGPQDRLGFPDELGIKNKKALFLLTLGSKIAVSAYDLTPVGPDRGKVAR